MQNAAGALTCLGDRLLTFSTEDSQLICDLFYDGELINWIQNAPELNDLINIIRNLPSFFDRIQRAHKNSTLIMIEGYA